MANTKAYLEQVKYQGEMHNLLMKAAQVEVEVDGAETTLAAVLADIKGDISSLPTTQAVNSAVTTAISQSGHARFTKVSAVPSVDEAEENILYLVLNASTNHYDIYAKIKGEDDTYTVELLDDTTVDLTNYILKVTGATENNIATFAADGSIKDSGKKVGGSTLAASPNANTLATEAAVSAGLATKANKTDVDTALAAKADKTEVDALPRVHVGTEIPADMKNGDLFIHIVSST